jgi:hypothetical protein
MRTTPYLLCTYKVEIILYDVLTYSRLLVLQYSQGEANITDGYPLLYHVDFSECIGAFVDHHFPGNLKQTHR